MSFGILLPEQISGLDGAGLIDALVERDSEDAELAARLWASGRAGGSPAHQLAAEIVSRPEPAPRPSTPSAACSTARSPGHAWLFLAEQGAVDYKDAPAHLVVQAGIDLFLATADLGSPADVVEMLLGNIPTDGQRTFVDTLASADHPRTGEILDLSRRHHPDEATATHARKAALRWRTRLTVAGTGGTS